MVEDGFSSFKDEYPQDLIDAVVRSEGVVVYSKSWCPHCTAAKQLLQSKGIAFYAMDIDQEGRGDAIQDALYQRTGQRTVPNIFVMGEHLGGNSDLQTANANGSLA